MIKTIINLLKRNYYSEVVYQDTDAIYTVNRLYLNRVETVYNYLKLDKIGKKLVDDSINKINEINAKLNSNKYDVFTNYFYEDIRNNYLCILVRSLNLKL